MVNMILPWAARNQGGRTQQKVEMIPLMMTKGYNPKGWVGLGEYRGSLAAFLYTWPDGDTRQRAIKLRKVGSPYSAEEWRRRSPCFSSLLVCHKTLCHRCSDVSA